MDYQSEDEMQVREDDQKSDVKRDDDHITDAERESVAHRQKCVIAAKRYHEKDFKRMREDMMIARQGASDDWVDAGNYTVPVVARVINQAVASLYAKNPTYTAEKRKTLEYKLWDGKPDTAMAALEMGMQGDANSLAIIQDIEQGRQKHEMVARIGQTLEIIMDYFTNEQRPRFKRKAKRVVRRGKTCGVCYLMLGFQRAYAELTPDETAELSDARNKLAELERRMTDFVDGELGDSDYAEKYELETLVRDLSQKPNRILREGPVIMDPPATSIIPDPSCTDIVGFEGASWVAREFYKSPKEIQKIYGIDISKNYTPYNQHGKGEMADYHQRVESDDSTAGTKQDKAGMVCVWEIYDKDLEQTMTIADGYPGYLVAPKELDFYVEGFWPIFALTFNDTESEEHLFPLSDTHNLKHVQAEYNRSREYRRMHREANKPKYVSLKGRLTENDKDLLESAPAHAVIEVEGMGQGERIENIVQRFQTIPIDPALYETNSEMEDVLRTVGAQEANIGGVSGASATESSIAEGSRMTFTSSNVDDLDEFLTDFFSAFAQMLLMELSPETVMEIAGPAAMWPDMNREQVAKQLNLKVRAGSSGRPNKAAELANMERGMPYLIQLPGVNPHPLGQRYADLLELDLDEIIVEGLPSIQALNAQLGRMSQGAGGPNDPAAQGNEGASNAPSTQPNEPGAQPSFQQPIDNI